METYYICKKKYCKDSSVRRTKQSRLMLLLNCAALQEIRFIKNQETSRLQLH